MNSHGTTKTHFTLLQHWWKLTGAQRNKTLEMELRRLRKDARIHEDVPASIHSLCSYFPSVQAERKYMLGTLGLEDVSLNVDSVTGRKGRVASKAERESKAKGQGEKNRDSCEPVAVPSTGSSS